MCDCGGTLKIDGKDEHFLVHESQEEDDDRTRIYHSTEMDGAIMYGKSGKKPPMWLHSIMKNEMKYLNGILHGKEVDEEFRPLLQVKLQELQLQLQMHVRDLDLKIGK